MDEVEMELAKMIRETRKGRRTRRGGAGQVASAISILAAFQRADIDPNALLREVRLPHEDMPEWDDIVLGAEAFLGRYGT